MKNKLNKDITHLFTEFSELKKLIQLINGEIVAIFFEDYMIDEYFQTLEDFKSWADINIV